MRDTSTDLVFVPDASVTLPWCFEGERTSYTEALLDRLIEGKTVIVPSHWPVEVLNTLVQAKKRGRVEEEKIQGFLRTLDKALCKRSKRKRSAKPASPGCWG